MYFELSWHLVINGGVVVDKNKLISQALVASMLAGVVASGLPTNVFADNKLPSDLDKIKSEGAKEAVKYLYQKGKLSGFSDNTFRPDQNVTRAEFIAMVLTSVNLDKKVKDADVTFTDSKPGNWHYDLLKKAYSHGLLSGKDVTRSGAIKMAPNEPITRDEILAILVRAHELVNTKKELSSSEVNEKLKGFKDASKIPSWAKAGVAKALNYGLTAGVAEDKIGTGEKGNRVQSAIFTYRMLKNTEKLQESEGKPGEEPKPGEEQEADTKPPVITLKGAQKVTVFEGDSYDEAGVSAIDDVDGDVSAQVVVTGDAIDTSKPGTYVIKYNVSDKAGNKALEVLRTVEVKSGIAKLEEEIIQVKTSGLKVGEAKSFLAERHALPADSLHFVVPQATLNGATPVKVEDVSKLLVYVEHTKVGSDFTKSDLYDVIINDSSADILIDTQKKTVTVKDTNTLNEIKSAFETKAVSIIGENSVTFYKGAKDTDVVYGDSIALLEGNNNEVKSKIVKFVFGDSLVVQPGESSLTVKGLKFEELLDLYSYNPTTKVATKVQGDVEVGVDGTYSFVNLVPGKYKIVQQPLEFEKTSEEYTAEYSKRLRNENIHDVLSYIKLEANPNGAYRLLNNYSAFGLTNTDATKDFVKDEQKVADITGSGELKASIDYEFRTERVKFSSIKLAFATETVDHDNDPATPNKTYHTVALNPAADFTQFTLGQSVKFKLVLKDYDANGKVTASTEVPLKATVVLKNNALALEVKEQ